MVCHEWWVVGRGSGVRDPHTKFKTRHIYSFYAVSSVSNSSELSAIFEFSYDLKIYGAE